MKLDREKIVYKKVEDLKLNPKNPRKNDEAVHIVAKSIEKYGFKNPLIIDENNVVWCGNTRLKASRTLRLEEVPCIVASDLTEEQIRELALIDNKSSEIAEWDFELLGDELAELDLIDFELDWSIVQDDGYGTDFELPSGDKGNIQQITFTLSNLQAELVKELIDEIQDTEEFKIYNENESDNANKNGNALYMLLLKVNLEE
jgi:site-specific DNA-methyltransferase (adenine-specific)